MKVIKIIEEGRVGGPHMDILRISPKVQRVGINVSVVLPQKNSSDFQKRLTVAGIPFYATPMTTMRKHPNTVFSYVFKFIPELFCLTRLIRQLNPDLVHVSGGSWQIKGVLAGRLAGEKVVWHLNDTKTPKVIKLLFGIIQPLAHAFITAGHRVQEYYLAKEKIRPIFNISAPVDCSVFNPALVRMTLADNVCRIITIANISPVKGLENFLELAAKLNQKSDKYLEFRVVGVLYDSQKEYYERLKALEKKLKLTNLVFVGGVKDVRNELANADIYVCSSLAEASPTSVWEAMAMGKPIISTNVGEVDHVFQNGDIGFIVPIGNVKEIVSKVDYLLLHPLKAQRLGRNAREKALNRLDTSIIAQQHADAYQTIIRKFE